MTHTQLLRRARKLAEQNDSTYTPDHIDGVLRCAHQKLFSRRQPLDAGERELIVLDAARRLGMVGVAATKLGKGL